MGSMNMDSTTCMKIHQFARDLMNWDRADPKLSDSTSPLTTFDLKTFIGSPRTGCVPTTVASTTTNDSSPRPKPQVETHPGGTRWNPTQEQIELLEAVYKGGMRTPNAEQIERITERLSKHGKIEGKNVFYWFQNHKARERQRHKRNTTTVLALSGPPRTSPISSLTTVTTETKSDHGQQEESVYKRKRSWASEEKSRRLWSCSCKDEDGDRTLELFPLHPEGRF